MSESKRLNIQLTPQAHDDLNELVTALSTNRTVLTCRALRIYKRLVDAEEMGSEILIHGSDGTAERVLLIP
jgi:hypothetical protein